MADTHRGLFWTFIQPQGGEPRELQTWYQVLIESSRKKAGNRREQIPYYQWMRKSLATLAALLEPKVRRSAMIY